MEHHMQMLRSKRTSVSGEWEGRCSSVMKGLGCLTREFSNDPLESWHDKSGVLVPSLWGPMHSEEVLYLTWGIPRCPGGTEWSPPPRFHRQRGPAHHSLMPYLPSDHLRGSTPSPAQGGQNHTGYRKQSWERPQEVVWFGHLPLGHDSRRPEIH